MTQKDEPIRFGHTCKDDSIRSTFIQNYERNLVETAVETTKKNIKEEIAKEMKKKKLSCQ